MTPSFTIVWLVVSLLLSLFFSGSEVVYLSSDKLKYVVNSQQQSQWQYLCNMLFGHPRQFLATLVVGRVIALLLFVSFSQLLLQQQTDGEALSVTQLLLFYLSIIVIILLINQFLPRLLFQRHANFWMRLFMVPAFLFYILFYPLARFFMISSEIILRLFGIRAADSKEKKFGRSELDAYVKQSIHELGNEEDLDSEVKIFRNALDFSGLKIKDCMVPRAEIVAVSLDTDIETLKEKFIETGLSRILVFKEDIDDIVGYIHIWEIFSQPADWTASVASISFVPESMSARQLMSDLMQQHKSIAVVVDEFGGTSGIVTMEDLVEEIFGEIEDEYDVNSNFIKREGDNSFVLSGRVEIDHLNEIYHLGLPESDAYSTVAGYLLYHTQRFPKTYETVVIGKYTFKILKVTARKIEVVRLQVSEPVAGR